MRILLISTYWPEYSGPAVRINKLNSFIGKDIIIITTNRKKRGISFKKLDYAKHKEFILEFRFFYILDFLISFIFLFFLPFKSNVHTAGSSAQIHALFLLSNIRKDLKLIIELVNSDSSPVIIFNKFGFKIKPRKKSTLILALNSNQKTFDYKTILKPNPISNEFLSIPPRYEKIDYPISKKITLGYLSKFKLRKNQIFLIDVMRFLPSNFNLILAGPTDALLDENGHSNKLYLDKIYQKINSYNLQDRVKIEKGFINASKFYQRIDHYLIPSYNEGFGTSIVEAIASGIPVNCNKSEKAFYDCAKLCPDSVKASEINYARIFAEDVIEHSKKIKKENLEKSRNLIIDYCSEKKIFRMYSKIFNL